MKARVVVYRERYDGPPLAFQDVDIENISLIDSESHGKSNEFGITTAALRRGKKLLINSGNVAAVAIEEMDA